MDCYLRALESGQQKWRPCSLGDCFLKVGAHATTKLKPRRVPSESSVKTTERGAPWFEGKQLCSRQTRFFGGVLAWQDTYARYVAHVNVRARSVSVTWSVATIGLLYCSSEFSG